MLHSNPSFKAGRSLVSAALFVIAMASAPASAWDGGGPLLIDHICTDMSKIPASRIDRVQETLRMHFAHTSHGMQISVGLIRLRDADPSLDFAYENNLLPDIQGAFNIFNGMTSETYVMPDLYWATQEGMDDVRSILTSNPSINISMFIFCQELETASEAYVDAYLDAMSALEAEFPGVTFVYTTGNAQMTGAGGYNRYLRNERIRDYCRNNGKVLYDFADLDAWWYDPAAQAWEKATYDYEGTAVPVEHPQWAGNDAAHTSYESCEQKTRAMWWLAAELTGWAESGSATGTGDPVTTPGLILGQNYPNPFNPSTTIAFSLHYDSHVRLEIYDAAGRRVRTLIDETLPASRHEVGWDGRDDSGSHVSSGVYFYSITARGGRATRKMILLN